MLEFYLGIVEAERRKIKRLAAARALTQHAEDVRDGDFVMD